MSEPKSKKSEIRAESLLQRMGFRDKDLYNQAHDRICLWLKNNISTGMARYEYNIGPIREQWLFDTKEFISYWRDEWKKCIERDHWKDLQYFLDQFKIKYKENQWHAAFLPFKSKTEEEITQFITDFATNEITRLKQENPSFSKKSQLEYPVMNGKYLIGFIDLCVVYNLLSIDPKHLERTGDHHKYFYYEVKSVYDSIGSLIREINTYREFIPNLSDYTDFYVVGPKHPTEPNFESILKAENIGFIEAPTELFKDLPQNQIISLSDKIKELEDRIVKLEKQKPTQRTLI